MVSNAELRNNKTKIIPADLNESMKLNWLVPIHNQSFLYTHSLTSCELEDALGL